MARTKGTSGVVVVRSLRNGSVVIRTLLRSCHFRTMVGTWPITNH